MDIYETKIRMAHLGVAYGFITEKDLEKLKKSIRKKLKLIAKHQKRKNSSKIQWKWNLPPKDEFFN